MSLITKYQTLLKSRSPQFNICWGFLIYILLGWLLLCLPWARVTDTGFLDDLFIATSAVSTTGLVTVDVGSTYNLFGQIVIVALFQIGGIGYMTLTTYYLLFTTRRITRWHRDVMSTEFTIPSTIRLRDFIRSVIVFTLVMESLGAIALYRPFVQSGQVSGEAAWNAIFHSISAFCTAGFSLYSDSFSAWVDDPWVNTVISILAISGSLGFIVITDLWYRLTKKSSKLSFTTKLVVSGFIILLVSGTLMYRLFEPAMSAGEPWLSSFFASMTAMTTVGFNTTDTGSMILPVLLMTTFLMYVGASPSGTAGGLKITTLTAMLAVLTSRLNGKKKISFIGRRIPFERLYVATSSFILYTSLIFFFCFILSFIQESDFDRILFEVASALGTVGLSAGLTGELGTAGKVLFVLIMYIGRVGVLTFGFALVSRQQKLDESIFIKEDLAV